MYRIRENAECSRGPSFATADATMRRDLADLRERAITLPQRRMNVDKITNPIRRRAAQVAIQQEEYQLPRSILVLERALKRLKDETLLREGLTTRCA